MGNPEISAFKDHFSGHAQAYASARPGYPDELFAWLASQVEGHELAWDAGCGNGQASRGLKKHFARVLATDASPQQIANAGDVPGIDYRVAPAEDVPLDDASCDLVTAAQAAHWFDLDRFHAEVRRVLKPGGVVALWCYGLNRIAGSIDPLVQEFYGRLEPDWPPERALIERRYESIPFPYDELPAEDFEMTVRWRCEDYLAYLASWSAVQRNRERTGTDPVAALAPELTDRWGETAREVRWPLHFRIGRRAG